MDKPQKRTAGTGIGDFDETQERTFAERLVIPKASNSSGVVLVEFSLMVFGVLIGLFLLYDFGEALNQYLELTQIAREGIRSRIAVPALETGKYPNAAYPDVAHPTDTQRKTCERLGKDTASPPFPCGHYFIQDRIYYLLTQSGLVGDVFEVSTEYKPPAPAGGPTSDTDNTVIVEIGVTFRGHLNVGTALRVHFQGDYVAG